MKRPWQAHGPNFSLFFFSCDISFRFGICLLSILYFRFRYFLAVLFHYTFVNYIGPAPNPFTFTLCYFFFIFFFVDFFTN